MSNQARAVKGATCVFLSVFVILCAITDEVDCQRGFSFRRLGGGFGRTRGSGGGTIYNPPSNIPSNVYQPPSPSVAKYVPPGFEYARPGEYRPILTPVRLEPIELELDHLRSFSRSSIRPTLKSTKNFDLEPEFKHLESSSHSERQHQKEDFHRPEVEEIMLQRPSSLSSSRSPMKGTKNFDWEFTEPEFKQFSQSSAKSTKKFVTFKKPQRVEAPDVAELVRSFRLNVRRQPKKVVSDDLDLEFTDPEFKQFSQSPAKSTKKFDFQPDTKHSESSSHSESQLPNKVYSRPDLEHFDPKSKHLESSGHSASQSPVKDTKKFDWEPLEEALEQFEPVLDDTDQPTVKSTNNSDLGLNVKLSGSCSNRSRHLSMNETLHNFNLERSLSKPKHSIYVSPRASRPSLKSTTDFGSFNPSTSRSTVKSTNNFVTLRDHKLSDFEPFEPDVKQSGSFNNNTSQPSMNSTQKFVTSSVPHHSSETITEASAPSLEHVNNKSASSELEFLGSPKHSKQIRNAPLYEGATRTEASAPPGEHVTNNQPHGNASTESGRPLPYVLEDPVGYPANVQSINNPPPGAPFLTTRTEASAHPEEHVTNNQPHGNASTGSGRPLPYVLEDPVGYPANVQSINNPPPGAPFLIHPPPYTPHSPGISSSAYNSSHNPAGYGPPPAFSPVGYGIPSAHGAHSGGYGLYNIVTNNGGGGLGYNPHSYNYSSNEVGSGILGLFLGYSLAKVTTPTYHYHSSFYDGYTPRYDHYEVHHYYHQRESVPAQSTIQPSAIVGCVGDSGTICPNGTTSLCTNNGAILCVASATSTVPCTDGKQGNCVKAVVPCVNGTGNCEVGKNTTITIPCISTASVPGNITYINNTIIVNQTFTTNNNINSTSGNSTINTTNRTMLAGSNLTENSSVPLRKNLAQSSAWSTLGNRSDSTTEMPITLSPTPEGTINKREAPAEPVNNFCVAILALPAKRKSTEQEEIVKKGTSMFSKFLVKALGDN